MSLKDVEDVVKNWYYVSCPEKTTSCKFASIGHHLLDYAIQRNELLLTLQVGAMDGKSNDPMYEMFVEPKVQYLNKKESFPTTLQHWLPVLIEPVPFNYNAMLQTYAEITQRKHLGCSVPIHASVSYNNNNNNNDTTTTTDDKTVSSCPFCRVNTDEDAPTKCKEFPDWMKLQLGTLDCEYSKTFFNKNFDDCVVQDPLPCSSIVNLLHNNSLPMENIAMLQIDIEGYEYILLQGFFQEIPTEFLPPIIHFEHKVMKEMDD